MSVTELGNVIDVIAVFWNTNSSIVSKLLLESNIIVVKDEQPLNTDPPIYVTKAGMVIDVRAKQFWNAKPPINVSCEASPNVIVVKAKQPSNTAPLIIVTELGMVIDVRAKQFWNANSPMNVTELGMLIDVKLEQFSNTSPSIVVSMEYGSNVTSDKLASPLNAEFPMVVTFAPILALVKD